LYAVSKTNFERVDFDTRSNTALRILSISNGTAAAKVGRNALKSPHGCQTREKIKNVLMHGMRMATPTTERNLIILINHKFISQLLRIRVSNRSAMRQKGSLSHQFKNMGEWQKSEQTHCGQRAKLTPSTLTGQDSQENLITYAK
jgi:hypothetical protein